MGDKDSIAIVVHKSRNVCSKFLLNYRINYIYECYVYF